MNDDEPKVMTQAREAVEKLISDTSIGAEDLAEYLNELIDLCNSQVEAMYEEGTLD